MLKRTIFLILCIAILVPIAGCDGKVLLEKPVSPEWPDDVKEIWKSGAISQDKTALLYCWLHQKDQYFNWAEENKLYKDHELYKEIKVDPKNTYLKELNQAIVQFNALYNSLVPVLDTLILKEDSSSWYAPGISMHTAGSGGVTSMNGALSFEANGKELKTVSFEYKPQQVLFGEMSGIGELCDPAGDVPENFRLPASLVDEVGAQNVTLRLKRVYSVNIGGGNMTLPVLDFIPNKRHFSNVKEPWETKPQEINMEFIPELRTRALHWLRNLGTPEFPVFEKEKP